MKNMKPFGLEHPDPLSIRVAVSKRASKILMEHVYPLCQECVVARVDLGMLEPRRRGYKIDPEYYNWQIESHLCKIESCKVWAVRSLSRKYILEEEKAEERKNEK